MKIWHFLVIGAIIAVSLVLEFTDHAEHEHHWWSAIPGFYLLVGLLGSCLLILFSALIVGPIVRRDEQYYER